nr:MAG TPA: hypothetical protein [Caudoviricetes sp.]
MRPARRSPRCCQKLAWPMQPPPPSSTQNRNIGTPRSFTCSPSV